MINKAHIEELAKSFLNGSDNYLIEVKVSAANKIIVQIENDAHVSISDCVALSRHIEHSLDREQEDFELEVSSPGIDQPFKHPRQYKKYQGREIEVKLLNGEIKKGVLEELGSDSLQLKPLPDKKNKKSAALSQPIPVSLKEIKEARLVIRF